MFIYLGVVPKKFSLSPGGFVTHAVVEIPCLCNSGRYIIIILKERFQSWNFQYLFWNYYLLKEMVVDELPTAIAMNSHSM